MAGPSDHNRSCATHVSYSSRQYDFIKFIKLFSLIILSAYKGCNYLWYKLYDENIVSISPLDGFTCLKFVHQLDTLQVVQRHPLLMSLDPEAPPTCTSHSNSTTICILCPCGHNTCAACLGIAMVSNSTCPICS
jgi:hypothetical protein